MLRTITEVESGERGQEGVLMGSHPSETAPPLEEEQQLPADSALSASRSSSPPTTPISVPRPPSPM